MSQEQVTWEKEIVWLVTAYFPNNLDTVMELNIDVLHITETHDYMEKLTTPADTWGCHSSTRGIKSQGAATFTHLDVTNASSDTNVSQVQVTWEKETVWLVTEIGRAHV